MHESGAGQTGNGRERLKQVFRYLKALNEHRNPATRDIARQPWAMRLADFPDHPAIVFGVIDEADAVSDDVPETVNEVADAAFLFKVRRPELTAAPSPPPEIRDWLLPGWQEPGNEVEYRESRNETDDQGETVVVRFEDDPARPTLLEEWGETRAAWSRNELPAREAMKVFERLYELHGRLGRESERVDLVLGDGILSWRQDDGSIFHPIVLQRVQLRFDPAVPEFTVHDSDHQPELYTALFQSLADVDGRQISQCREELEEGGYHPLAEETSAYLKRVAVALSSQGQFTDTELPDRDSDTPRIGRAPVLYLRSRTLGFSRAVERVLETIELPSQLCPGLLNIVGVETAPDAGNEPEPSPGSDFLPQREILFGKPANPEQVRIARRLNQHGAVLVQGPPGTGKSHTIANLVGHLLAQQKSVLVTSHTTKALRVLRGLVADELKPLCVSVLDSDLDSRRQLEQAVQAISNRLSESDAEALEREAARLETNHEQIIRDLEALHDRLLKARTAEYRDVVIEGDAWSPADAARQVAAGVGVNDWIPGPVRPGAPLPLSHGELTELYATNGLTRPEDDRAVDHPLPALDDLMSPEDFDEVVSEREELAQDDPEYRNDFWHGTRFTVANLRQLKSLTERFQTVVDRFRSLEAWQLPVADAGRAGGSDRELWEHLLTRIEKVRQLASEARFHIVRHAPSVESDHPLDQERAILNAILRHLQNGGTLNWLVRLRHPSWSKLLKAVQIGSGPAVTVDHFRALEFFVRLKQERRELCSLWDRVAAPHGLPSSEELGDDPEQKLSQYATVIHETLDWYPSEWRPLLDELEGLGFDWETFLSRQPPNFSQYGQFRRVVDAVSGDLLKQLEAHIRKLRAAYLHGKLKKSAEHLDRYELPAVVNLRQAIRDRDATAYRQAFDELTSLSERRDHAAHRRQLLSRLEGDTETAQAIAENWAAQIRNRIGVHGEESLPGDPKAAWQWRQLHDELQRRAEADLDVLGQRIEQRQRELRECTVELIDCRAWAGQIRRTTLHQRQALMGWLDTIRKIGRGYGKRAAQLKVEARRKMSDCRDAVPVWIMPLARLVENFDFGRTQFDVVIIDEASQSDVMALLALAIAKKVVVVGDHEQVSPSAVGQDLATVQNLIQMHLQGIPNSHLYDGKTSVYDLARQSFGGTICLLEHFRCVPDIIGFSNHLSYEAAIKPLRDASDAPVRPHVIPHRVEAAFRSGKVNREEALTVASLLVAATEHEEYRDQTFGVISMVGSEQALEIERILLRHLDPQEFEGRRIICGNAAQFQGDEREVMFLSLVDAPREGPLALQQRGDIKQRYNVAASRARNQMWVVHSLDPETDLKPGDLRRRLIEHALDPQALDRQIAEAQKRAESPFEEAVIERLVRAGYRVVSQWPVGKYRIDIVVEGGGNRLAVECDGDRFHTEDQLAEDVARQAILERVGWTFVRLRGSQFYRDPDAAMESVFGKLEEFGIPPEGAVEPEDDPQDDEDTELLESIRRRAAGLRRQWEQEEADGQGEIECAIDDDSTNGERPEIGTLRESAPSDDSVATTSGSVQEQTMADAAPRSLFDFEPESASSNSDQVRQEAVSADGKTNPARIQSSDQAGQQPPDGTLRTTEDHTGTRTDGADNGGQSTADKGQGGDRSLAELDAVDAKTWFAMSHWAKQNGHLTSWERRFCFSQGIRVKQERPPSAKQTRIAQDILRKVRELGFDGRSGNPAE